MDSSLTDIIQESDNTDTTMEINMLSCMQRSTDNSLLIAASRGHLDCVAALLKYVCDLSICDNKGWTPLICAVRGELSE